MEALIALGQSFVVIERDSQRLDLIHERYPEVLTLAGDATLDGKLKPGYNLFVAVGHAALGEIVGRQFHLHAISLEDANVVLPHLAREIRQDLMAVL
jgi:hypothetical protein